MRLIKFVDVGKSFLPRISLSPTGLLSISDAARKKYSFDDYQYVVLYSAPDENYVVLELTNEVGEGAIQIRKRPTGAYLAAGSFVGKFEISVDVTTIYDLRPLQEKPEGMEDSILLYFELSKGTGRRSGDKDED